MPSRTDHPLFPALPPLAEDLWQALRASGIASGAAVDVIDTLLRSAAPADLEGRLVLAPPHGTGQTPQGHAGSAGPRRLRFPTRR